MFKDRLDDVGVVVDPKLIRDGQEQRVGRSDGFVFCELLDEDVRLGGVAAAKDRSFIAAEVADGVPLLLTPAEIGTVTVVDECKDAAADRHPRLARMTGGLPRLAEYPDLFGLLDVEGTSALVDFRVELCRFMPSLAAHSAVALVAAPHQIRSRRPSEYGSTRSRPGGFGNIGCGFGCAKPSPRSTSSNTSVWRLAMSASVIPSGGT